MGVSPINSIPYVAMHLVPLSLGTLSLVFYLVNIAAELVLSERKQYISILLQLPVSLLFGVVIDLWDALLPPAGNLAIQIVCLCGSIFLTAFGIMLIVIALCIGHVLARLQGTAGNWLARSDKRNPLSNSPRRYP